MWEVSLGVSPGACTLPGRKLLPVGIISRHGYKRVCLTRVKRTGANPFRGNVHFSTLARGWEAKGGLTLGIKGVANVFCLSCAVKTVQGDCKIEGKDILFIENKVNVSYLDRCVAGKKEEKEKLSPIQNYSQTLIGKITLHSSISTLYIV